MMIKDFLSALIGTRAKLIAVAVGASLTVGASVTIWWQHASINRLSERVIELQESNTKLSEKLTSANSNAAALADERNEALARERSARQREREIRNVHAGDTTPVPDVLADSLDRLR